MKLIPHTLTARITIMEFRVWLELVSLGATRVYSVLYRHYLLSDASPKAISGRTSYLPTRLSGRTSYLPTRLEFLPYPQVIRGRFNERRFSPPVSFTSPSTCSWIDRRVSGLSHRTKALFRLAFAATTSLRLNLNSPVHSSIGTPSPINGLWLFVSIQFQILFTPLPGFFSPFLHSTGSLSVIW